MMINEHHKDTQGQQIGTEEFEFTKSRTKNPRKSKFKYCD